MDDFLRELWAAAREVADAYRALDMAAPDYVDSAIYRVNAAQTRYSALLQELARRQKFRVKEKIEGLHRDQG